MGVEAGAQAARSRALAVLRIRSRALAVALLPAAVAVVLLVGGSTGQIDGPGWGMVRDLADRLEVPAPSAIALTPDCDSWLEDRTHPAHGAPRQESHDEIVGVD